MVWLETILGITEKTKLNDIGVLGRISGYYGTVETQGRGSLHLNMVPKIQMSWQLNCKTGRILVMILETTYLALFMKSFQKGKFQLISQKKTPTSMSVVTGLFILTTQITTVFSNHISIALYQNVTSISILSHVISTDMKIVDLNLNAQL